MKKMIVLAMTLVSVSSFAQEDCRKGYSCELTSDNQAILRLTKSIKDENIYVCQTVTVANYGANLSECVKAANTQNAN